MSGWLDRRSFLVGMLGGVVIGAAAGFASGSMPHGTSRASASAGTRSYAQQGEDLVVAEILRNHFHVVTPTYIDIGAHDPVHNNNTYLFYTVGGRGVLVEPNPTFAAKLRRERPGDVVLEEGIGPTSDDALADYYIVRGDGQLNTFSKEQADRIVQRVGPQAIERMTKVRLVNVNKVLAENFPKGAPDFFSVDTEGLDLDILRSLDFSRFRPKVVCAETAKMDGTVDEEIVSLMKSRGYAPRGGSFVNIVFIDTQRAGD